VGDPPIADSSGAVASISIFPAASSLIDKSVKLWAAKGTVRTSSTSRAASEFSAAARLDISFF